jgi:hypothetical protein
MDLLQGRVPKSVFVRHYLKENPVELRDRVLTALTQLEQATLIFSVFGATIIQDTKKERKE